jgi:cytochrome c peroxidase
MEYNFSLFFGLATQLYMATLVADDTPYDRFMDGDSTAISAAAIRGVDLFRSQTRGRCINCHEGAELTGASVTRVKASPVRIREGQAFDRGFNNIGVRATTEDIALGANDPFGQPLSYSRSLPPPTCPDTQPCPIVADGFYKVPGLRNVALTAPYFHNGGTAHLRGVLDLYSRGGDFAELTQLDGSMIMPLNVLLNSDAEKSDLEAFLLALTDDRVLNRRAPFDHPQIFLPDGHPGDETRVRSSSSGNATDRLIEIPAVGREGNQPLKRFLEE